MPYIVSELKDELEEGLQKTAYLIGGPGQLNYAITYLIKEYFHSGGNYQAINDVLGALEGAKLEFYRRVAQPYEDRKAKENGDVYD